MHLVWMWPIIVAVVFTVWACVNVLTGRVARDHRLAHLAYVPLLWLGCLHFISASSLPIAIALTLTVALPCGWIIIADYLRAHKAKN